MHRDYLEIRPKLLENDARTTKNEVQDEPNGGVLLFFMILGRCRITFFIDFMLIYEDLGTTWGSIVDTFRYFFDVFSDTFSGSDSGAIFVDFGAHFHDFSRSKARATARGALFEKQRKTL